MIMKTTNILIVGGGVVGLTLANELARRGHSDIVVADKEQATGLHASGRNSGVLHAGIYYAPGTAKARFCLAGNRRMKDYCREKGLPLDESGKVIVATSESRLPTLMELYERATSCGTPVTLVDERELAEIEPNAFTVGKAIHSPETAVVDPKRVLASLADDLAATGKAEVLTGARVTDVSGARIARTTRGDIEFKTLFNCAGAHADKLAHAFGVGRHYRLVPFKGVYKKLVKEKSDMVRGSIYPVPDIRNPFLGVHFTRSVHGDVYLGPTAIPAFGRENYGIFKGMDAEAVAIALRDLSLFIRNPKFRSVALTEPKKYVSRYFFNDARKLVKHLDPADIEHAAKVGIRSQLVDIASGEMVMDFLVERGENSVHVLNAISPAFTGAFVFAEMLVDEYFAN